jgi:hypothetical protein
VVEGTVLKSERHDILRSLRATLMCVVGRSPWFSSQTLTADVLLSGANSGANFFSGASGR